MDFEFPRPPVAETSAPAGLHAFFQDDINKNLGNKGKAEKNKPAETADTPKFKPQDAASNRIERVEKGGDFLNFNETYMGLHAFYLEDILKNSGNKKSDSFRSYNDVYQGLHTFWAEDVLSSLNQSKPNAQKPSDSFRSYNDVYMGLHTFWLENVRENARNNQKPSDQFRSYNDVYMGIHTFFNDDVRSHLSKQGNRPFLGQTSDVDFRMDALMKALSKNADRTTPNPLKHNDFYMGLHTSWRQDNLNSGKDKRLGK